MSFSFSSGCGIASESRGMPEQAAARKLFSKGARTVKINLFRLALALLACTMLSGQAAWALTPEQFNMLKEKAEAGNADAQQALGSVYNDGEVVRQDFAKARFWYEKAAMQEHALAQALLGILYLKGQGVSQDYSKSFYWFKKSSDNGYFKATVLLGMQYENGYGVGQDKRAAKKLYGKACDKGYSPGCREYRRLNEEGY